MDDLVMTCRHYMNALRTKKCSTKQASTNKAKNDTNNVPTIGSAGGEGEGGGVVHSKACWLIAYVDLNLYYQCCFFHVVTFID